MNIMRAPNSVAAGLVPLNTTGKYVSGSNVHASMGNTPVSSPCAACKLLRRRCVESCTFAPHFPADEPLKFASVHRVFGASNVSKMLQELPMDQRGDAVSSMVYEANARIRDPIYGCVGAIANLQRQVIELQTQLAMSQAQAVQAQWQCEHILSNIMVSEDIKATSTPISQEEDDTSSLRLSSDTFSYE